MWTKITNIFARFMYHLTAADSKETWGHLELRRKINLENLEDLKKLRIKNF